MFDSYHRFEILLVEDNPADVLLIQEAFEEGRLMHRLSIVQDGEQAVQYLRRTGNYADAPRPDVILLDLNLPKKNGRELLADIKEDDALRFIPIIVLTTSGADEDISTAYKLHANCYLTKPVNVDTFIQKIRSIENFWLTVVRLPSK